MSFSKSPLVGAVAGIAIIVGLVFAVKSCGGSRTGSLRESVSWRECLACHHRWQMDTKEMMEQRLQDPTGNRFVQCPKCHEWRGAAMGRCLACGKAIPKVVIVEAEDGSIRTMDRLYCDECLKKQGEQPTPEEEEIPEDE
jgi:hypothetical protein